MKKMMISELQDGESISSAAMLYNKMLGNLPRTLLWRLSWLHRRDIVKKMTYPIHWE